MSTNDSRGAFEYWFSDEGAHPKAIERSSNGGYILASASHAWNVWQAATEAAKATGTAGEQTKQSFENLEELPPLPLGIGAGSYFTANQMREYGQQCAEAARQPAPALPVKTWQERVSESNRTDRFKVGDCMTDEIADLRTALASTAAPVLSDEQIDHIARSYFADDHSRTKAKDVIHDALVNARVLRPDHRETLEQIAHFLHNSVRIQQNAPNDYYPATEFDSQLQQAADEIGSIIASTNRSQPAPAVMPPAVAVSRDADSPGMTGVLVTFAHPLSDGQLRELHEYLNRSQP